MGNQCVGCILGQPDKIKKKSKIKGQEKKDKDKENQNTQNQQNKNQQRQSQTETEVDENIFPVIQQEYGLTNLGNTCFLNSALQFLFASKSFVRKILKANKKQQSQIQKLINNLFTTMKMHPKQEDKEIKTIQIQQIIQYLKKSKKIDYKSTSQQDCLQFLLFILNELRQSNPIYLKMFQIEYTQNCLNKSCNQKSSLCQYYLSNNYQRCPSCGNKCEVKFKSKPANVIFLKVKKQTKELKFKFEDDKLFRYKLSSQILYSGQNTSGHYISKRRKLNAKQKDKQKLFFFNDEVIEEKNEFQSFIRFQSIACLYEFEEITNYQAQNKSDQNRLNQKYNQKSSNNQPESLISDCRTQDYVYYKNLSNSKFNEYSSKVQVIDKNDKTKFKSSWQLKGQNDKHQQNYSNNEKKKYNQQDIQRNDYTNNLELKAQNQDQAKNQNKENIFSKGWNFISHIFTSNKAQETKQKKSEDKNSKQQNKYQNKKNIKKVFKTKISKSKAQKHLKQAQIIYEKIDNKLKWLNDPEDNYFNPKDYQIIQVDFQKLSKQEQNKLKQVINNKEKKNYYKSSLF